MKKRTNQKIILQTTLIMFWLVAGFNSIYAQSAQDKAVPSLDKICRMHDAGSFLFFKQELKIDPNTIFETYKSNFGLQREDEMNMYRSQRLDKSGVTIYRYQQYHNDIPVHGAVMNVFEKNGSAEKANGRLIRNLEYHDPMVSAKEALQIALQDIDPQEYEWTDPVFISRFSNKKKFAGKTAEPTPELVYMYHKKSARQNFDHTAYELCWDIKLNLKHSASKEVFISAVNGKQVNELPLVMKCFTDAKTMAEMQICAACLLKRPAMRSVADAFIA